MNKSGIVGLGLSAAAWSGLAAYIVAGEQALLLIVGLAGMYVVWTVQTVLSCKCGKEAKQEGPAVSRRQ